MNIIWPDIFITGTIPADRSDAALCADALSAWANARMDKAPENFGNVMAEIATRLNVVGTPESFRQWAGAWEKSIGDQNVRS